MPYGTIKVDTVTFTNAGVDKSVTLSGLVQNPVFSGNVTVTGTLSGVTVTGTTANFTSGNFTNISGGTHTITSGVFAAGSAASPSITFTGDLNTGIYSPGADQVAISTGGSGRLFVDASGNVTVDYSSASVQSNFRVKTNSAGAVANAYFGIDATDYFRIYVTNGETWLRNPQNTPMAFHTNNTERLRITSAGLVGVGTSSPGAKLDVSGDVIFNGGGTQFPIQFANAFTPNAQRADLFFSANATSNNALRVGTIASNGGVTLQGTRQNDSSQKVNLMLNPDGGSVGIGTTSPACRLHLDQGTNDENSFTIRNEEVGANFGAFGTGSAYARQFVINATRIDGGSFPYLRIGGQEGIIFAADLNSERARIDSSGRLLVGTSSTSGVARTVIQGYVGDNNGLGLLQLQVGSTSPGFTLGRIDFTDSNSNAGARFLAERDGGTWTSGSSHPTRLVFSTTADGASSPTERMRIGSNGNFLLTSNAVTIAPNSGTGDFYVQGVNATGSNARIFLTCPGSNEGSIWYERSTSRLYIYSQSGGVYLGSTATSWTANSDERLKDIVEPIENAADKVSSLRAVIGKYKTDEEGTRRSFLIAQDVQAVLPEAVDASNPDSLGVSYTDVIPLLVAAIKEQQAMIAELQAKVAALETK